jgi:phospholipase/carboxylesterase
MLETDFVPAQEKDSPWLMVVLHGLGDSMEGYRWLPQMLQMPQLNYLLVNAPDDYYGGFSWYDFALDPAPGVRRSYAALSSLLDEQRQCGFQSEQTFLFGFSQGCLMTIEVGLRSSNRFAGIIGISGYVHEPERLLKALSPVAKEQLILLTHGTEDPLIPIGPVRAQIELLKAAGLKIDWHEFAKVHTIAGEEELNVIRRFIQKRFAMELRKGGGA